MTNEELIAKARQAQQNAYAPYSGFKVGAALLSGDGKVFTGCNVENASYGLSVCAERTAIFKAVSEGIKEFAAMAIAGSGEGFIYPCGACLQVLAEFAPEIKLIITDEKNRSKEYNLQEMLPRLFVLR
ncbi:cytidine deaminase [Syntrophomonas palmitatica]|uniref:cytidine deaminase n=1 Tax=Syntrophomonas palmitatica TaxID=402877 RepID=UPI0006D0A202|nr:cytidine deaminase [Syntrophomonas palmitatica]